jgi:hypothetical protein
LVAVTVYNAALDTLVGEPLMTPVCESKSRPVGKLGATAKLDGMPPPDRSTGPLDPIVLPTV